MEPVKSEHEFLKSQADLLQIDHINESIKHKPLTSPLTSLVEKRLNKETFWKSRQTVHQRKLNQAALCDSKVLEYSENLFIKAGPREQIYQNPEEMVACIATCGGLCPGLNVCVYTIYKTLIQSYGVSTVYGVFDGYKGFTDESSWVKLDDINTYDKFNQPGSFLRSSRGKQDMEVISSNLVKRKVKAVFIIGGEGSHFGADVLQNYLKSQKISIAVTAIPKTIDNDIPVIDVSFGHSSAIEIAVQAIHGAYTEAQSIECCLGIVKVMGRDTGHIAVNSSVAFGEVDIVLIPEMSFELYGENGFLKYLCDLLLRKRRVVIVVAEGANKNLLDGDLTNEGNDKSGNTKFGDIGLYLKSLINSYCKKHGGSSLEDLNIKYIDPSYMLRSMTPNCFDRTMCMNLSRDSVHGIMAGFRGFSTGIVNSQTVYIPLSSICSITRQEVDFNGEAFHRMLQMTGQPVFINKKS